MYKLFYSTSDFCINNVSIEKVPFLVKEDDMSFEEVPTLWFIHLALNSSTSSHKTWKSYAEAIYDWFQSCHYNGWDWKNITKEYLNNYKNHMLHNNSALGKPYARNTINNYVKRVCIFYEWCVENKYVENTPFNKKEVFISNKSDMFLGHLKTNNLVLKNELMLKNHKRIPVCLTSPQLSQLNQELGVRDALVVKWSVMTGMRKKEVLGLTLKDIPNNNSNDSLYEMQITITKGDKPRKIFVPQQLIDETNEYIKFTRRNLAKKHNNLNKYDNLWLGEKSGEPISESALNKNFLKAVKALKFECTFHHLRHTYAIKLLSILTKQSKDKTGLNPIKTLQTLLGHSNISTTMVYLEALSIQSEQLYESLDLFYKDLSSEEKL